MFSRVLEGVVGAASLFFLAREMLEEAEISPRDLGLVGAARGPGAFTGVRTAVMAAKALGEVLGIPLVAPESLAVVATARGAVGHVFVVADARRGQVYYALYEVEEGPAGYFPLALEGPGVASPRDAAASLCAWMEKLGEEIAVTGTGAEVYRELLPAGARREDEGMLDPGRLAGLCRELYGRGETVDPLHLEPLYLRYPDVGKRKGRGIG